jgi:AhpD family alkylhydroperoxidase
MERPGFLSRLPCFEQLYSGTGIHARALARFAHRRPAAIQCGKPSTEGDHAMEHRMNPFAASPKAYKAMETLQGVVDSCGLERPLLELVKLRTSQINGCAYCLDMHSKDARALGETEQRIYALNAWRETPFYTERERAALEWAEAVTLIAADHAPDDVYELVAKQFTPEELANLTFAIATINSWNRLCIAFRIVPGSYKSNLKPLTASA